MQAHRKKSRKLLFQKLYSLTMNELNDETFTESFYDDVFTFDIDTQYINEMLTIIIAHENFFLQIIQKYSPKFNVKNMNIMYILPMFIGLAEMFYLKEEIPAKVSINESVEIAKAFGDDSAKKIVNGFLNKVYENFEELNKLDKQEDTSNETNVFFKNILH